MTAIERTAYPRFKRNLTAKDLAEVYTPTPGERFLAARSTKRTRINMATAISPKKAKPKRKKKNAIRQMKLL